MSLDDTYAEGRGDFRVADVIAKDLARHLEEQIVFGGLAAGSRLVEEEIVQRYNVSRSPVREALRLLEQEGLAVRESRRGVWVSSISVADLNEVYSCRLVLEGLAAELAAQHHDEQDLQTVRSTVEGMERAHRDNDLRAFFRRNLVVSESIHSAAHNHTLKRLLGSLGKQAFRYRYLAYQHAPEMMAASVEGHHEILRALEKRNARHARTLMEDLLQRSWSVIRDYFERVREPDTGK